VAPLIDPVDQPDLRRFCLRCRLRAGWDELHEVVSLLGDRVDARVHPDPQRPIGQSIDAAPLTWSPGTILDQSSPAEHGRAFLGGAEASDSCHCRRDAPNGPTISDRNAL
jgi:hypothetical protein